MPTRKKRRNKRRNDRMASRSVSHQTNRNDAHQVSGRARRDAVAHAVLSDSEHPPSIVDSEDCSSLSLSSAAEDYISNLVENGSASDLSDMDLPGASHETPPTQHPHTSDVQLQQADQGSSPPTHYDVSDIFLERRPIAQAASRPSDAVEDHLITAWHEGSSSLPSLSHSVIEQSLQAFDFFTAPDRTEMQYVCNPDRSAVVRLALHKVAEAMGATSKSNGTGKYRRVVMSMDMHQDVPLTKVEFKEIVEETVAILFSEKPKKLGKEKQSDRRRRVRMERKQRKMELFMNDRITSIGLRARARSKKNGKIDNRQEEKVGRANVGFGMLERMGWREGQGLGAEGEGVKEPLAAERRRTRAGLGC